MRGRLRRRRRLFDKGKFDFAFHLPEFQADFLRGLDMLMNNPGITTNQAFIETSAEQYHNLIDVRMCAICLETGRRGDGRVGKDTALNVSSVHV